ncbi:MAG: guanylate kinase [Acidobacteria bacterium]|nr:guanylate kinase [Acidobacteriota bacterium]MBI3427525.1 guanylate kinase [Acidobacteriota bacterium]
MQGNLIIVSAPSGAGKTTLVSAVLADLPRVSPSVSYTSRPPRSGELDGLHYHFVTRADFTAMIEQGEFLEWAEVHGNFYGTSRVYVEKLRAAGEDVILTIDVQGATQTRRLFPDAVGVFIMPPSYQAMRARLGERGANRGADLALRLQNARAEIAECANFDYVIINDEVEPAVAELAAIILAERCRCTRRQAELERIRQTFESTI